MMRKHMAIISGHENSDAIVGVIHVGSGVLICWCGERNWRVVCPYNQ